MYNQVLACRGLFLTDRCRISDNEGRTDKDRHSAHYTSQVFECYGFRKRQAWWPSVADASSELIGVTRESGCALPKCWVPAQIGGGRGDSSPDYRSSEGVFCRHGYYLTAGLAYGRAGGILTNGGGIVAGGRLPHCILAPGVE